VRQTAEHLTAASLRPPPADPSGPVDRGKSKFVEDEDLPIPFRARLADYFRSGYDRGHMCVLAFQRVRRKLISSKGSPRRTRNLLRCVLRVSQDVIDAYSRKQWTKHSCCPTLRHKSGTVLTVIVCFLSASSTAAEVGLVQDWAYLEDWCRRLTGNFADVYVFTVPLYLPRLGTDGKWRVVCILQPFMLRRLFFSRHTRSLAHRQMSLCPRTLQRWSLRRNPHRLRRQTFLNFLQAHLSSQMRPFQIPRPWRVS
jgi:hypothetical protein